LVEFKVTIKWKKFMEEKQREVSPWIYKARSYRLYTYYKKPVSAKAKIFNVT